MAKRTTIHTAARAGHLDDLIRLATDARQAVVRRQADDPWGQVRLGGSSATPLNDTGQRRDGSGLL